MSLLDFIRIAAIGLSIVVVLLGLGLLFLPPEQLEKLFDARELPITDFATLERPKSPNSYLLCPPGFCPNAAADAASPAFDFPVEELRRRLLSLVDNDPDVKIYRMDVERGYFDFVARTATMRFPDVITVQLAPLPGERATLAIFSHSIYGHSDLGANRKRIDRWLAIITP